MSSLSTDEPRSSEIASVGPARSSPVSEYVEAMAQALRRGEKPRAEDYLTRLPNVRDEDAVRLIYEEACLRQEEGEEGVSEEILGRFPRWRDELALLLECNRALRGPKSIVYPELGDQLGDLRIIHEIGRGSFGRTYIALQHSLAQRPMVLKVTPLGQHEHLSLAKLQHMHIVPLYFEEEIPARFYRVLGMPYLGGGSLARVLELLASTPVSERQGSQITEAIDWCSTAFPKADSIKGPFRDYFNKSSYVRSVCLIGSCLAEALQYAHDRGLIHLDVKPSNVLLAGDGQPMLLDFHLAQAPIYPGEPLPDRLGGTPGYNSPEQNAAMDAMRRGGKITRSVDGRSDVYSLGLLLYETLGGDPGTGALSARRSLETCNPSVSPGLSDIVAKCLAYNPNDRYPDAAALALDLNRHLNDQPLLGVRNRNYHEYWTKWRRRKPAALSLVLLGLGALVVAAGGGYWLWTSITLRNIQIDAVVRDADELFRKGRYPEAVKLYEQGVTLADQFPVREAKKSSLNAERVKAVRALKIDQLHGIVEGFRAQMGITPLAPEEAAHLVARGRLMWQARGFLVAGEAGESLPKSLVEQARTDLLDLATTVASLSVTSQGGLPDRSALKDAVSLLHEAQKEFQASPALVRDLQEYQRALDPSTRRVAIPAPRTASDYYNLGLSYMRTGDYVPAQDAFQHAIDRKPNDFWSYFSMATCAYRRERFHEALEALNVCIALAPATPECFLNRARVHEALGDPVRAIEDDTRALERNPKLTDVARHRGELYARVGRYDDAIRDLEFALVSTTSPATLGKIESQLARIHRALKNPRAARLYAKKAVAHGVSASESLIAPADREPPSPSAEPRALRRGSR